MVFTGIVQGTAAVQRVQPKEDFASISISFPDGYLDGIKIGASVAINGTCLTVTDVSSSTAQFDIIKETLRATNLGNLHEGSLVNFERSARFGDEVGGHNVSGHVHTVAGITNIEQTPNNQRVTFRLQDTTWMKYIFPKGYIAVDGTSLTVGEVTADGFTVYLIPETLRVTVLGSKKIGDSVNIEVESQTQTIVDTVERVLAKYIKEPQSQVPSISTPLVFTSGR